MRRDESQPRPLIAAADVQRALLLLLGRAAVSVFPRRYDADIIRWIDTAWRRTKSRERARLQRQVSAFSAPRRSAEEAVRLVDEWYARRAELAWGRLRDLQRLAWPLEVEVEGTEHLEAARDRNGQGTVLWYQSFCDNTVLARGLAQAGFPASHLSSDTHGSPGRSRFGAAFVTPLHARPENRRLQRRIVMRQPSSPGYVREIERSLAAGAILTIRGDLPGATARVSTPILGRASRLARGAPTLAVKNGAELLTSHATRLGPRHYRLVVEPPVVVHRGDARSFVSGALVEFVRRLERNVSTYPADWEGWWWVERLLVGSQD